MVRRERKKKERKKMVQPVVGAMKIPGRTKKRTEKITEHELKVGENDATTRLE